MYLLNTIDDDVHELEIYQHTYIMTAVQRRRSLFSYIVVDFSVILRQYASRGTIFSLFLMWYPLLFNQLKAKPKTKWKSNKNIKFRKVMRNTVEIWWGNLCLEEEKCLRVSKNSTFCKSKSTENEHINNISCQHKHVRAKMVNTIWWYTRIRNVHQVASI